MGALWPTGTWGPLLDFMAKRMICLLTKMNSSTNTCGRDETPRRDPECDAPRRHRSRESSAQLRRGRRGKAGLPPHQTAVGHHQHHVHARQPVTIGSHGSAALSQPGLARGKPSAISFTAKKHPGWNGPKTWRTPRGRGLTGKGVVYAMRAWLCVFLGGARDEGRVSARAKRLDHVAQRGAGRVGERQRRRGRRGGATGCGSGRRRGRGQRGLAAARRPFPLRVTCVPAHAQERQVEGRGEKKKSREWAGRRERRTSST